MKNKEITIYELMGLIKDNKAPKKIKYNNIFYEYDDELFDYFNSEMQIYLFMYVFNSYDFPLDRKVEILPEENDEWEDIKECSRKAFLDLSSDEKSLELYCYVRDLNKNQKYLKERLDKDE